MANAEVATVENNTPYRPKSALQQRLEMDEALAKSKRRRNIILTVVTLVVLLVLIVVGFFMGIYMRVLDVNTMNETLHLYDWPVVGQYFVKLNEDVKSGKKIKIPFIDDEPQESRPVIVSKYELERRRQAQIAAERKRINKLARLYDEMKPKEAAAILEGLSDDVVIAILRKMDETQTARILTALDPERAARITQIIYSGMRAGPPTPPPGSAT